MKTGAEDVDDGNGDVVCSTGDTDMSSTSMNGELSEEDPLSQKSESESNAGEIVGSGNEIGAIDVLLRDGYGLGKGEGSVVDSREDVDGEHDGVLRVSQSSRAKALKL